MNKMTIDEVSIKNIQETILSTDEYEFLRNKYHQNLDNFIVDYESQNEIDLEYFANIIYKKVLDKLKLVQNEKKISVKEEISKILSLVTNTNYSLKVFYGLNDFKNTIKSEQNNLISNDFVDTNFMWKQLSHNLLIADEIILISPFFDFLSLLDLKENLKKRSQSDKLTLKILSTTFDGKMQFLHVEALKKLYYEFKDHPLINIEIKIEDARQNKTQRLHSKSFIFKSATNFGVAYVGSGNFTKTGLKTGKEWNIKITEFKEPRIYENLNLAFEEIWNDENMYEPSKYEDQFDFLIQQKNEIRQSLEPKKIFLDLNYQSPFDLTKNRETFKLKDFQIEALDKIQYERGQGINKHLLIMATGTGKTFVAASDFYRNYQKDEKRKRLLFVAERKELLQQAISSYRFILNDRNFGTLCFSGINYDLKSAKDVFITFDSLLSKKNWDLIINQKDFDYIVIDEAHHIGAKTYQNIIEHFSQTKKDVLGLTATPLREDGKDVKTLFNNRYTFELNLWDSIEEGYLSDFNYYMIEDETIDLTGIDLRDEIKLVEKLNSQSRKEFVLDNYRKLIQDNKENKTVVFCHSINHAEKMATFFQDNHFLAKTLTSKNVIQERNQILNDFKQGKIDFLCVVDILNEGVDIKDINNVMFLRPTESKTLFIQQMGRGLRKNGDKVLNILDFVNNIDMQINKNVNPLSRINTIVNENINIFEIRQATFLNFINAKLPGNSSFKMIGKSSKEVINYLKSKRLPKIEQRKNLEKLQVKTYQQYIDYFINNDLQPQNVYDCEIKKVFTIDSFVLTSNQNQQEVKSRIMCQFAYLNNIYLINEFLKIIDQNKLGGNFLINNLFVASFYSELTSNKQMEEFKKAKNVTNLTDYLFSNHNQNLLKEISFLLRYRVEHEYQSLIANQTSFKGTIFTWQQTKAFAKHVDFTLPNVWNMSRSSGFESLTSKDTEINIYTDDKTAYQGENLFNYSDEYKREQEILFWFAPGGKNGWKKDKENKFRTKLWTPNRVINCFHKDSNLINKFGSGKGIYEFIGKAKILKNEWKNSTQELYWFSLEE